MEMKYSDKGTRSLFGREVYSNVQPQRYPLPSFTSERFVDSLCVLKYPEEVFLSENALITITID